jgi:broad specificity phosphatase PhoE
MGQILLVRHAQARFGTDDYDRLSELGREQARALGTWLAGRGRRFDAAVTGSLRRHRETAESCLEAMPEPLRPAGAWRADAGFDEYDADEILLRHNPEFADGAALRAHLERSESPRRTFHGLFTGAMTRWMEGGNDGEYRESWSAFRGRCVAAMERLATESGPSRTTVVFTSGGPIAALCQHLLGLDARRTLEVNSVLVNCATTGLLYNPQAVSLAFLNNYSHLENGDARMVTYR